MKIFFILSLAVTIYLFWALIYHRRDKSLSLEVIVEYILTALLAVVILYGTLV